MPRRDALETVAQREGHKVDRREFVATVGAGALFPAVTRKV